MTLGPSFVLRKIERGDFQCQALLMPIFHSQDFQMQLWTAVWPPRTRASPSKSLHHTFIRPQTTDAQSQRLCTLPFKITNILRISVKACFIQKLFPHIDSSQRSTRNCAHLQRRNTTGLARLSHTWTKREKHISRLPGKNKPCTKIPFDACSFYRMLTQILSSALWHTSLEKLNKLLGEVVCSFSSLKTLSDPCKRKLTRFIFPALQTGSDPLDNWGQTGSDTDAHCNDNSFVYVFRTCILTNSSFSENVWHWDIVQEIKKLWHFKYDTLCFTVICHLLKTYFFWYCMFFLCNFDHFCICCKLCSGN